MQADYKPHLQATRNQQPLRRFRNLMRYFFNLAGAVHDPDNHGAELASFSDARIMAVRVAADLLKDRPEIVWVGDELRIEVTDENQLLLCTVIVSGVDAGAGGNLS